MITLAQAKTVFSYDPETGLFTRVAGTAHNAKVGVQLKGTVNRGGYCVFNLCGTVVYAHRLAWLFVHGTWPPDDRRIVIDHINRDKTDNRISNLRLVSGQANGMNRPEPKHNTSGHKGVSYISRKNKWRAHLTLRGRYITLGDHDSIEQAVAARREGERVHFGGA